MSDRRDFVDEYFVVQAYLEGPVWSRFEADLNPEIRRRRSTSGQSLGARIHLAITTNAEIILGK